MAYRVLELNLVFATDLKKVTLFSRMRVYAVASISGGDPRMRMPTHATAADRQGGCNPAWNAVFHFPIPSGADTRGLALHVLLRAGGALGGRDVGEAFVPVDDLLAGSAAAGGEPRPATYQVRRPRSGRAHGVLHFCYRFIDVPAAGVAANKQGQYARHVQNGEKAAGAEKVGSPPPPAIAYPAPQHAAPAYPASAGYPSSSQPYPSYAAPPPYEYPQPAVYGYAAPPPPARRHGGGMGAGLGLGLLGGAVGGMMIGEMIGDAEVDAAYDAGFDDGLEF